MNLKKIVGLALTTLALNISILGNVNAASIDVKCEARGLSRSKLSVDGAGLAAGLYRASVSSGTAAAIFSKALQRPVNGEVEFDYDSNVADIRAGATTVPSTFIKNRTVTGKIFSYDPVTRLYRLRASMTESCAAK